MFLLECMLHNVATIQRKEWQRHSQGSEPEMPESVSEHPSVWILLGSPGAEILKVVEQVYRRELAVAPSVLPCRQQDGCMRKLCWELTRHMSRASLQSETRTARPSLRGQRCSCSHSIQWACSPSARPWGLKQPSNGKKMPPQDSWSQEGIPILGAG